MRNLKDAIDIFGQWAEQGKDVGMEKGHTSSVNEMLSFALEERLNIGKNLVFFDLGCGNGWVVEKFRNMIYVMKPLALMVLIR